MNSLLQVNNLCKNYGELAVIHDISFTLEEGEILCLLGPSGSRKTTLLRQLPGLETADSGSFRFDGQDMALLPPHKRNFGMMFQEYALFPHKNVADNISFGLEMLKWNKDKQAERIQKMLEMVGLQNKGKRPIDKLSGGERQRVALARSLAPGPRLLLLDEPLGSLDRVLRDRLAGEIRAILKKQQLTAVFVTHDQAEAFAVADRIAILKNGQLEQFAEPEVIYRKPGSASVAAFLGFRNLIDSSKLPWSELFKQVPEELKEYSGQLLIRPEGAQIQGRHPAATTWPQIKGTVLKRQFQGQVYALTIKVQNTLLHFDLPLDPIPANVGEPIILDINPGAMVRLNGAAE
jgi:ABC-type Fe3+/spermidine/putrescine transport system ATPase subunit